MLLISSIIVIIFVCVVIIKVFYLTDTFSKNTMSASTFKTDEERRQFLSRFFPVKIPDEATNFSFEYQSWQDWSLQASFTLPKAPFRDIREKMERNVLRNGKYEIINQGIGGVVYFDQRDSRVTFSCEGTSASE